MSGLFGPKKGGTETTTKTQQHKKERRNRNGKKKWWVDAQAHRTTATKNYAVCCPHMGTALPSQPPKCKGGQPDSGTACVVTVTTQPGMLKGNPKRDRPPQPEPWPQGAGAGWARQAARKQQEKTKTKKGKEGGRKKGKTPVKGVPEISPLSAEQPLDWGNWVVFN